MVDQAEIVGPVIVIEGDPQLSECIDVFKNVDAAATYLEPWFADETHFIVTWDGIQLRIVSPDTMRVVLSKEAGAPARPDIARRALTVVYGSGSAESEASSLDLSNLALANAIVTRQDEWLESRKLKSRLRRLWSALTGKS